MHVEQALQSGYAQNLAYSRRQGSQPDGAFPVVGSHESSSQGSHSGTIDLGYLRHLKHDLLGFCQQLSQRAVQFGDFLSVDEPSPAANNGNVRVCDDLQFQVHG